MKILSESIADYIELNYDISSFSDKNELEKVEELVINRYNYSLEECSFYAEELSYFSHLKKCTFINFEITGEVVETINQLHLTELILDNCDCILEDYLRVEKVFIESSNVSFPYLICNELVVLENDGLDIDDIIHNNLTKLTILNTPIIHSKQLINASNCDIEIQGCSLDDYSIKDLDNVNYNPEKYCKL